MVEIDQAPDGHASHDPRAETVLAELKLSFEDVQNDLCAMLETRMALREDFWETMQACKDSRRECERLEGAGPSESSLADLVANADRVRCALEDMKNAHRMHDRAIWMEFLHLMGSTEGRPESTNEFVVEMRAVLSDDLCWISPDIRWRQVWYRRNQHRIADDHDVVRLQLREREQQIAEEMERRARRERARPY